MATYDLDSLRVELVRDILDTDSLEVLRSVKRALSKALSEAKEKEVVKKENSFEK
ncbi:hypothetical protein [uncultured Parabacteroides sp.]|uniref:hypothetical protein n=1 Tax=uncultured Parabacteroides sp. TaxID=512312 RepID=UPI0025E42E98|nr:hypothetical protein [uncultured Parabacteroides sp.]